MLVTNVIISPNFPFHIFSEVLLFEKHCTASKSLGSWQFSSPDNRRLFHASQHLLQNDVKLYFIDQPAEVNHIAAVTARLTPAPTINTAVTARLTPAPKINTAKNLQMLLDLHCAHDHWNFEDVAAMYGLTLPTPLVLPPGQA
jgi:hypothetical protein